MSLFGLVFLLYFNVSILNCNSDKETADLVDAIYTSLLYPHH